jgi:histidinol-phosphate aminotransferase
MTSAPDDPVDLTYHGDQDATGGLLDLAVNVRTEPPPAWLTEAIITACGNLARYPDSREATAAIAAYHGRPAEEVLLTAGAAEAFGLLAAGLPARTAAVVHPQFTEPERALRLAGHRVVRHQLRADEDFVLEPSRVPEAADLVVIGNPTNPTGVLHPPEAVMALARPGRTLVVDEAFLDAVPGEPGSLAGRSDPPGLVVVRSLTKTWGLAGLRIGYLLGPPPLIRTVRDRQPPWAVSTRPWPRPWPARQTGPGEKPTSGRFTWNARGSGFGRPSTPEDWRRSRVPGHPFSWSARRTGGALRASCAPGG